MQCCSRLQSLHQTQLRARSKVRVDVRTLLRAMSELRLYRLDGVPARHRLACDRVAPEGVVTEGPKSKCSLDDEHRAFLAVDVTRKGSVPAEQELGARVALSDVPADRVEDILRHVQRVRLLVLARDEHGRPVFGATLDPPVDDQLGWEVLEAAPRDGVDLRGTKPVNGVRPFFLGLGF